MKKYVCIVLSLLICLATLTSCTEEKTYKINEQTSFVLDGEDVVFTNNGKEEKKDNIKVKVELKDGGFFVMELYPKYAPKTVANFCNLVEKDFYNGLIFHRVIPGFMAQTGDPKGNGTGGSEETVEGEFKSNGFDKNTLKHLRGTVSMARTNDPNSASSQFFICFGDASYLDGDYAAFGKVVYGMDVVDTIGEATTDEMDKPVFDIAMKKVSFITDEEYNKIKESK